MSGLATRIEDLLERMRGVRVLVVGDLVADHYVYAEPSRLSREAPVVVTRFEEEHVLPGGAANAVRNLAALGAQVTPLGVVGADDMGTRLLEGLAAQGAETGSVIVADALRTVTKTRFLVGEQRRTKQQVFRIDAEPGGRLSREQLAELEGRLVGQLPAAAAVLLSDYGYGAANPGMVRKIREVRGSTLVTADSRYSIGTYGGVDLATPNVSELEQACGRSLDDDGALEEAGAELSKRLGCPGLLVTRGNQGMSIFRDGLPRTDIPATGVEEVTDVSGAGDTVIAVATLALAAGAELDEAAWMANLAAGVVVTKVGPATCGPDELGEAARRFV